MSKQLLDTPSKHSSSLTSLADRAWNRFSETVINAGWSPLSGLSEAAVVAVMRNMSTGQLRVLTYSNIYTFPSHSTEKEENKELKAELRVVNDVFWVRLCAMGDLGFSEAYMYGDVECDDLVTLFRIFLDNREKLSNMDSSISFLFQLPQKLTSYRFLNTISNSRSNISAHYDISNDMFQGFLSKDMTYSCAIFEDLDGDLGNETDLAECNGSQGLKRLNHKVNGTKGVNGVNGINGKLHPANGHLYGEEHDPLYDAQMRKLRHILKKAKIQPGHRVLEIGSGWGSMAILIAQSVPDTTIDTLTLSVHQQTLARERIAAAGLQDRITVHLMDYRDMPSSWEGAFDRFISIEMIEAVGAEFIVTYWRQVDWALKKKGGVGVIQVITIPEARYERYIREIDFIRKWIFPGGFLPTVTLLHESMKQGSKGTLTVDSVTNIGPHYARTLREWRRRFLANYDNVIIPALQREYPEVMSGPRGQEEIEVFKRKWIYYYCYCEVGFTTRTLGDHIVTFTREGCMDYGCEAFE